MLRSFLIYLSQAGWAQKMVTGWSFAWSWASRFVAGESVDDAIRVVRGFSSCDGNNNFHNVKLVLFLCCDEGVGKNW